MNRTDMGKWEKIKSIIMGGSLHDTSDSTYLDRRRTFDQYLELQDVDEQLGLSEAWLASRYIVNPLDQEAYKKRLAGEYRVDTAPSNFERATVLCVCPNVEEILFASDLVDRWREADTNDKAAIAVSPIGKAGLGEVLGRAHRFEHLRYLSIDMQFIKVWFIVPFMRLPSLRHLVLDWRDWTGIGFDGQRPQPR